MAEVVETPVLKEQIKTERKVLTLVAFRGKQQSPCPIRPVQDRFGKLVTGQQSGMTEEEKRKLPLVIDESTKIVLQDRMRIDLNDPIDAIHWEWMKHHPYIAMNRRVAEESSTDDVVFYVENLEKEAHDKVKKASIITKAKYKILEETTAEQRIELARVLGLPSPQTMTTTMVAEWLITKVDSTVFAEIALDALNPENKEKNEARIFVNDLINFHIIKRTRVGFVYENENWRTEEEILSFVLSRDNFTTTSIMKLQLEDRLK